uniref:ATP-grasp domain-containing protein n=1 Tax=Paenibacillus sp. KS-LC4 TaxID=2979727 RepID=UPI00403F7CF6
MVHPLKFYYSQGERMLWYMNIEDEQRWNTSDYFPNVQDIQARAIVTQQEHQLIFLADSRDTVFFRRKPDSSFLEYCRAILGSLPSIISCESVSQVPNLASYTLVPFVMTDEIRQLQYQCPGLKVIGPDYELCKKINNKFETRRLMEQHGINVTEGDFCSSTAELIDSYDRLISIGYSKCVLKVPHGSSGKGLKIVDNSTSFQQLAKYIGNRHKNFEILLEGWHPHKISLTAQLLINEREVQLLAITEQVIDSYGVYKGTNFTPFLTEEEASTYSEAVLQVGRILQQCGYAGVAGVDSIIGQNGVIYPVIEINARLTQVSYIFPFVQSRMSIGNRVQSKILVFNSALNLSFDQFLHRIQDIAEQNNGDIVVYNFCKSPGTRKYLYKIFILLMVNENDELNFDNTMQAIDKLQSELSKSQELERESV